MLTQEILRENFRYDPNTGDLFWIKPSKGRILSKSISSKNSKGYIQVCTNLSGTKKNYEVHRVIWVYVYGEIKNQIDHINGIRHDNRLCNLRQVTPQQNTMNRKKTSKTNKFKGIYYLKNKKKWIAEICFEKQRKYLGSFNTPEEAGQAYESAAKNVFKEYMRT
jgi:hypothetical protein